MNRLVFPLLLTLSTVPVYALDIKGSKLGDTQEAVQARYKEKMICGNFANPKRVPADGGVVLCGKDRRGKPRGDTYAGERVDIIYTFYHGALARISVLSIPAGAFDGIEKQLSEKFGKPLSRTDSVVTNRMGGIFTDTTSTWKDGKQELRFERFGENLERSTLVLEDADYVAAVQAHTRARRRKDM